MSRFLAVLGCVLLLPSVLYFLEFYINLFSVLQQLTIFGAPADPKLLAGSISSILVGQMVSVIALVPGIFVVSLASLKYEANQMGLYQKCLSIYAVLQLLTFPIISVIAGYLFWLKKHEKNKHIAKEVS